jgi:regulator of ribonuclease activity A
MSGMNVGVLALATHPRKTIKKNQGDRDVPVSFGGITFRPGAWLYADEDGVLLSPTALIP